MAALLAWGALGLAVPLCGQQGVAPAYPHGLTPVEGDYVVRDFRFSTGETLPELRIHYRTLGAPKRDASGKVTNAVLILHGTTGSGRGFLSRQFAGELFGPGQLLDANEYYIILPDGIGHGGSSKPSDGLHARFPRYDYDDMVRAQHLLVTEGLGLDHLRLILGTSMGCMHSWVWGQTYPEFVDGLMPLACLPVEIGGRNRIWRKAAMDAIRNDPAWNHGEYATQPPGLRAAWSILLVMVAVPLQMQKDIPTREQTEAFMDGWLQQRMATTDANDVLYALDASRNYNPAPGLEKIRARVMAVNSADDTINPPELQTAEREIRRVKRATFVLLPISDETRGHGTHSLPRLWMKYLAELLATSGAPVDEEGRGRIRGGERGPARVRSPGPSCSPFFAGRTAPSECSCLPCR